MPYGATQPKRPGATMDPGARQQYVQALIDAAQQAKALGSKVEYVRVMKPNLPDPVTQPNCSCHCGCS